MPSTKHEFDDTDICVHCGAISHDAFQDDIGCEAGPEGNPPWYTGLARTPAEQAAGVTAVDKALQQDARRRQSSSD